MISFKETSEGLVFFAITEVGQAHECIGVPNQDAVAFDYHGLDFVVCVSDGVGSCDRAEKGALFAIQACLQTFEKVMANEIEFDSLVMTEKILELWKESISDNIDDYCATLKCAIKKGNVIKFISLGDGFIAATSDGFSILSPIEEFEFSNQTSCLNRQITAGDFWTGDLRIDLYKSYVIFACTDGVANVIQRKHEIDFVNEIEKDIRAENLQNEIEMLFREITPYSFDDKTVGVVKYER